MHQDRAQALLALTQSQTRLELAIIVVFDLTIMGLIYWSGVEILLLGFMCLALAFQERALRKAMDHFYTQPRLAEIERKFQTSKEDPTI